ncbi:MAG: methyltransferase domain-containing protein [Coriobacteriia bacterium]|nr:methyltransferase domain-containing protein [Coriobacteriia bacterium]
MDMNDPALAALVELHTGQPRQGPGDEAFSKRMLAMLPDLPEHPRIIDMGCGSGAGTILLAEHFGVPVTAVDLFPAFLGQLKQTAEERGLSHLVRPIEADMGSLDLPDASIDLLWSEGAAYILTFAGALQSWRPFMADGGLAVISEISWFAEDVPDALAAYWDAAYPAIADESVNRERAEAAGYAVLGVHRLPSSAWWDNYYDPLQRRIEEIAPGADEIMTSVIAESEEEMELFRQYSDYYGYSFYILEAAR